MPSIFFILFSDDILLSHLFSPYVVIILPSFYHYFFFFLPLFSHMRHSVPSLLTAFATLNSFLLPFTCLSCVLCMKCLTFVPLSLFPAISFVPSLSLHSQIGLPIFHIPFSNHNANHILHHTNFSSVPFHFYLCLLLPSLSPFTFLLSPCWLSSSCLTPSGAPRPSTCLPLLSFSSFMPSWESLWSSPSASPVARSASPYLAKVTSE